MQEREREREREGREREKRRGTTTDPGRERRQKEKNMITCCSGLRRYRKSGVLRAKNKKKRKEPGPAPRREGGEEGQGGRERAKKTPRKNKKRENFSHAAFGQQKWGISAPEKPPRKKLRTANPKNPETQDLTSREFSRHFRKRKIK